MLPMETMNKLVDFDMALSLSEESINNQLGAGWNVWKRNKAGGPDRLSIDGADIVIGAPTASLETEGLPRGHVRMTLPIESATLTDGTRVTAFSGWTLEFLASFDERDLDTEQLRRYDAGAAAQVEDWKEGEDDVKGHLTVEALLMKLATGTCRLIPPPQPIRLAIPDDSMQGRLLTYLSHWLEGNNSPFNRELMLNCVVYPAVPDRDATFTLRDYVYKITCDTTQGPTTSLTRTLDYLGVFHGRQSRPLPTGQALRQARDQLGPWYAVQDGNGDNENVAGLMAVRGELFMEHVRRELEEAFELEAKRLQRKNIAQRSPEQRLEEPELDLLDDLSVRREGEMLLLTSAKAFAIVHDEVEYTIKEELYLGITLQPGKTWSLKGHARIDLDRTRNMWLRNSRASADATIDLNGTLGFTIENVGLEYSIKPILEITANPQTGEGKGYSNSFETNILQIANDYDVRRAKEVITRFSNQIAGLLKTSFEQVQITLDQMAFIPPGEKAFIFRNVRFSKQRDLMLDVMYADVTIPRQSPAPGKGTSNKTGQ